MLLLICTLFKVVQPVALRWHSWAVALPLLGSIAGTAVWGGIGSPGLWLVSLVPVTDHPSLFTIIFRPYISRDSAASRAGHSV